MLDPSTTAKDLIRRKGAVRSRELVDAGIARVQLSRMVASGELVRLSRGLYSLPEFVGINSDESVLVVAERISGARLCLLSALRLYGLTTQSPFEVWIAIGNKDRMPRLDWPVLRVVRYSGEALEAGLDTRMVGGRDIQVTNAAKTVADCFKFRNLVGLDVAIKALEDALHARVATADELWKFARICRVSKLMRPYLEALA